MASLIALGIGAVRKQVKKSREASAAQNDLSPEASTSYNAQITQTQAQSQNQSRDEDRKSSKGPTENDYIPDHAPPSYEQANSQPQDAHLGVKPSVADRRNSSSSLSSSSSASSTEMAKPNPGMSRSELKALKRAHRSERRLARDQRRSDRRADKAQYRADKRAMKAEQDAEIAKLAAAARQKGQTMQLDPLYLPREYAYRGLMNNGNNMGGGGSM
ncbi:hypothetical protein I316_03883 [Kwoniella heveanensis BCC8398]|uniref:Uncharacterized protein n=1 Tax=Kwoniella heveanensis BCC8398 TaxID=1296120 RepID=A0A1B9GTH3_9TREE|nr:hypothetical protein I316_03883 [Kwoniella heveanensis BCC8398]